MGGTSRSSQMLSGFVRRCENCIAVTLSHGKGNVGGTDRRMYVISYAYGDANLAGDSVGKMDSHR